MQASLLPLDPSRLTAAASQGAAGNNGKLANAGVEFESVLLGQWLQSAEKSFGSVPGSDEEQEDAAGDQMLGFAMQQLAHSIAAHGGLGIAKLVEKGLAAADASSLQAPATEPKRPSK